MPGVGEDSPAIAAARISPSEHSWAMAGVHCNPYLQGGGWQLFPNAAGAASAGLCRQLCCSFTHPQSAAGGRARQ